MIERKQNIYITLMKKLKRRLVHCFFKMYVKNVLKKENSLLNDYHTRYAKIILTTDPDLIKDSVQAIDDDF
jgi:hypothetical protein